MPQSLANIIVHLVFSTKDRCACLGPSVRPMLHPYLAAVARNVGCDCPRAGGFADHVHLAIRLSRTVSVATLVEELKSSSSKWLKHQSPELGGFAWQRGYGVFSVSPVEFDGLLHYIDCQEEHHRTKTFQEEYRAFLMQYQVVYDERSVGLTWGGLSALNKSWAIFPGALPQAVMWPHRWC